MWLAVVALTAVIVGAPALAGAAVAADGGEPAFTATKTVVRDHVDPAGGDPVVQDSSTVTVTVDQTQGLQGMQGVRVSWSGARPTANITGNITEANAFQVQEYPVVILQCRGTEPTPTTCWTTIYNKRQLTTDPNDYEGVGLWKYDRHWQDGELAALIGTPPADQVYLPFVDAAGKTWSMDGLEHQPPEATNGYDQPVPDQEAAAPTSPDGKGTYLFSVRSSAQNASLGCSDTVACSLVVIPIMGTSCASEGALPKRYPCTAEGKQEPGSTYPQAGGPNATVTGMSWWTPSNWGNRVVVPLTFSPSASLCNVLDTAQEPVPFYGSELVGQATLQWAPAYCRRADRFKFRGNTMAETVAFRNLVAGEIPAALLTYPGAAHSDDPPVGYAPVAVSGFAVAFVWDRPGSRGQEMHLRLTPRLIAKLLTGSYSAATARVDDAGGLTESGKIWPDVAHNPASLNDDPEFIALNPGLSGPEYPGTTGLQSALTSMISVSVPSDVMRALTSYLAADPEAAAFLAGEPDPWKMTVNSTYKGIALPLDAWPLQDVRQEPPGPDYTDPNSGIVHNCTREVPIPFYNRVLAPVSSLAAIADAVLAAAPTSLDRPAFVQATVDGGTSLCVTKRIPKQIYGSRKLLGLVTLADARRFGLPTASLRSSGTGESATFVDADQTSMAAAVVTAKRTEVGEPYLIDAAALHGVPAAYPGTMTVSVAAPLTGLPPETAGHVAQFVRVATTEGQVPGPGVGQLPNGYLPITAAGPTAPLYKAAQEVAASIEAQSGAMGSVSPTTPPPSAPAPAAPPPVTSPPAPPTAPVPATVPSAAGPVTVDGLPAPKPTSAAAATAPGKTPQQQSTVAAAAVPAVLAAGVVGLVGAPLVRSFSTRRRGA
ncbi:hypothetical protein [Cellulomonas sp. URHD0024]|uniref:hypothetical protein n=1 Tax=Cellulomonas sp. URHD0024 TaxID=1302620 RepID=UPI000411C204|nr:hypothetical protein [Cellulomonas sp. URHD0024]